MSDTSVLNMDYSIYTKEKIPNDVAREAMNSIYSKAAAISAISQILRDSEIERQAQGNEGDYLSEGLVDGLHQALIQLSRDLEEDSYTLGNSLCHEEKRAKNGRK